MKRFLIFLGILFSSVFITSNVNASEIQLLDDDYIYSEIHNVKIATANSNIDFDKYNKYFVAVTYDTRDDRLTYTIVFYSENSEKILQYLEMYTPNNITLSISDSFWWHMYYDGERITRLRGDYALDKDNDGASGTNTLLTSDYTILKQYISMEDFYYNDDLYIKTGNVKNDDVVEKQTVFDDVIYGTRYSKVELIFDIKGNVEQFLNFKYDFHLVQSSGKLDEYNTFSSPYFIENASFCSNNSCSISKDRYFRILPKYINGSSEIDNDYIYKEIDKSDIASSNSNSYSVNKYDLSINSDPSIKVTSTFKLVIDLTFDSSLIVDSFFQSSIPFTVKYIERDSSSSDDNYYSTIDITGKYGILFIPKIESSVTGINNRTLFQGIGHLDIQHRSSYDPNNYEVLSAYSMNYCNDYLSLQKEIPYSCNSLGGSFEFYITNDMLNQSLFFINTVYTNDLTSKATVTYDTRYYVYYVYDTPDTEITIKNPNTGEDFNLSLKDFFNYVKEKEELKISINTFLKPIKFILTSITDFYNNYCPAVVQKFLYISFMFVVVLIVIKIIW